LSRQPAGRKHPTSTMGNPLSSAYKFVFGEGLDKRGGQRESDQAAVEESKKRRQRQEGDDSVSQGRKNDRWIKDYDDKRQRSYYYNPARQEIVWKTPPPPKSNNKGASTSRTSSSSKAQWLQQRLPSGSVWKVAYDRSQRKPYYYNPTTQESKWELSSKSSSSSNTSLVVTIEYQGRRGLVVVATSPTESSSFSTLRSTIQQKYSRSVFYPTNLEEDNEEWIFQLKNHGPSSNIQIMPEQENNVELFQSLMRQYQQSQSSGTSPIPTFELVVVEKKENNEIFETSNQVGRINDHEENKNDDAEADAVLVENPVEASTATPMGRQNHQSTSLSSTTVSQPPLHARISTPQPTAQYQNHNQVNHPSPQAAAALGTRISRPAGTPNPGTTNRSGPRNSITTVPASTPPIPPLPPTTEPPKTSTTRRSGAAPPFPQPQQQQHSRSKPPTPAPPPPHVPPPQLQQQQQQHQQNLMTTRRTRRSNNGSSLSSFNQQQQHLGV